jgi:poly(3-hydroxybutyrate) depolymerase
MNVPLTLGAWTSCVLFAVSTGGVALGIVACGSSAGSISGKSSSTGGAFAVGSGGLFSTSSGGTFSTSSGGVLSSSGGAGGAPDSGGASSDAGGTAGGSDGGPVIGMPVPPPTPTGCLTVADVTPGVHQVTCDTTIDVLTVPEQCTKNACGVIVDVHGGMMSSQMEDKNTNLSALGLKHGYIVIQPNALQNFVLLNQRLFVADAPGAPADDTRVMDILTQVIQAFHADKNRIHMTGFSEGGYMTWRWFCQHSDILASVAPGAAAWQCAVLAKASLTPPEVGCQFSGTATGTDVPARDIPALYMQGTKDGLVDPKCADAWVKSNVLPTLKVDAGKQIAGDNTFTRTRYLNPDGVPFEYISHQYATTSSFLGFALVGHCYPGSTDLAITPPAQTVIPPDQAISFGCNDTCSFNWGEEVMKFFVAHPKH